MGQNLESSKVNNLLTNIFNTVSHCWHLATLSLYIRLSQNKTQKKSTSYPGDLLQQPGRKKMKQASVLCLDSANTVFKLDISVGCFFHFWPLLHLSKASKDDSKIWPATIMRWTSMNATSVLATKKLLIKMTHWWCTESFKGFWSCSWWNG